MAIIDLRQLPLVELVPIYRIRVDGLLDRVQIIDDDFVMTFLQKMNLPGSQELVAVPALEVRRRIADYVPSYLNTLVLDAKQRIAHGRMPVVGLAPLH